MSHLRLHSAAVVSAQLVMMMTTSTQQQQQPAANGRSRAAARPVPCYTLQVQLYSTLPPNAAAARGSSSPSCYRLEKTLPEFEELHRALGSMVSAQAAMARAAVSTRNPPPPLYVPPFPMLQQQAQQQHQHSAYSHHSAAAASPARAAVPASSPISLQDSSASLTLWLQRLIESPLLAKSQLLRDWFAMPRDVLESSPVHQQHQAAAAGDESYEEHDDVDEPDDDDEEESVEQCATWLANSSTSPDDEQPSASPPLSPSPSPSPSPAPAAAAVGLHSFHLLRVIGKGSFGKVMVVRKIDSGRLYALKALDKAHVISRNQVEHTRTERNVMSYVKHPYIVSLRFAFQSPKTLYFVLDYCAGGELFFHLGRAGRFSEHRARWYAAQLVLALEHLHSLSIIYRDLKPENVLLDKDGYLKLSDFGLSKEGVSDNSSAHSFCGTPEYLAPEILQRAGHGRAADWWSLGALVYEMLTGMPPFFSRTRERLFEKILHAELRIPRFFSPGARSLLLGLLDRDPSTRLGSSEADARELREHEWFRDIDWDKLRAKKIRPPFQPSFGGAAKAEGDAAAAAAAGLAPTSPQAAAAAAAAPRGLAAAAAAADSLVDTSNFDTEFTSMPLLDPTSSSLGGGTSHDTGSLDPVTGEKRRTVRLSSLGDEARFPGFTYTNPTEFSPSVSASPSPIVQAMRHGQQLPTASVAVPPARQHTSALSAQLQNLSMQQQARQLSDSQDVDAALTQSMARRLNYA